ncbi:DUF402 domain-containing protein [Deinococcus sonorensis]|uniref:DUF402 domain-containing protein n=2 Tax=Deinococcus sonorensis TaxID=309891 RepID=A0AAU7UDU5_9DEIO
MPTGHQETVTAPPSEQSIQAVPCTAAHLSSPASPLAHPIKTERHDTQQLIHHTNTGPRPVDRYVEHQDGLYVARRFIAHPRIRYWQAHLLPRLGIQLCRYDFHGERAHDYYIDVAHISQEQGVWAVRDRYLDVLVWEGLCAEVVDTDELLAAHACSYIGTQELHATMNVAHRVLNALARHAYDVPAWLRAEGVHLTWEAQPQEATV